MSVSPPRLAERFLQWCLRSTPSAPFIVGDLRQEFAESRRRRGRALTYFWYWREVLAIGLRYVGRSPDREKALGLSDRARSGPKSLIADFASDLRWALRVFRTAPGFAAGVVLTLSLGLGVNATMFGAVDRVLLSPPEHVRDHEELRFVHLGGLGQRSLNSPMAYSFPDYEAIRDLPALAGAAAYRPRRRVTMGSGVEARRPIIQDATAEFFPLLGVLPEHGRFFDEQDDRPGAVPVAVLSHGFWEREFGQDSDVIGRAVQLGEHSYEVVGVAPQGFTGANLEAVDVWVPLRMNVLLSGWNALESRGAWWFRVLVRLEDGVTDSEAQVQMTSAHLAGIAAHIEAGGEELSEDENGGFVDTSAFIVARGPRLDTDTAVTLLLAGVSLLVLLIACANVANLLLARGIDRQRERAVRLAMGVSRRRLVSQALAEALVLALAGGLAAFVVSNWSGRALYALLLPGVPVPAAAISFRLVVFLALVVLATTLAAALLPAVQALQTAPGDVLRRSQRGATRDKGRARALLTLGQVTLTTVLLIGAALFVQSLHNALRVDVGFDHDSVINVQFELQPGVDDARSDAVHREALELLTSMPGVERAVASSSERPLYGWDEQHDVRASRVGEIPRVPSGGPYTYAGTEGYVETAGLRIVRGRAFESDEYVTGGPFALMVSESFAEGVWPGLDPLEECVFLREGAAPLDGPEPCRPIVGVYEDLVIRSIADQGLWSITWPMPLETEGLYGILVRAEGDASELVQPIRDRLAALSSDYRYLYVVPMASRIEAMRGPWRIGATLFTIFGVLALLVASLGLYSVLTIAVAQRRREIGIRTALGAQSLDLIAMVVTRAAGLVGAGLVLGVGVAVLGGRVLDTVLFGVPVVNPLVFGIVGLVLLAAGLLAAWVPARKATAIDPVGAMAAE
ncbi:MAG: ADOP family duplicated permease [Acidobacteriota bacterium]